MPATSRSANEYIEESKTFCLLLYGNPGTGKTLLTASAQQNPKLANLGYVAADPGLFTIAGKNLDGVQIIDFTAVKDLKELPQFLKRSHPTVKTLVIDSISALASERMDELQGESDVVDWRYYGTIIGNLERIVHNLRGSGYNVIMTAGMKDQTRIEQTDKGQKIIFEKRRTDLSPGLDKRISHFVDFIWHTYLSPDGSYNILIRPNFPVGGGEILAKTRNESFNAKLKKFERPNLPGIIQIGKMGEDTNKFPNLNTFYNLYLEALKGE